MTPRQKRLMRLVAKVAALNKNADGYDWEYIQRETITAADWISMSDEQLGKELRESGLLDESIKSP
jgi:hypothetical protein